MVQYGFEFGHQAAIRDIKSTFKVPVLNDYGASEENRLALQCCYGSLHIRADTVYVEIIGKSGPCPPGVVGAIAITIFDTLTPLVRYLIGDAACWTGNTCKCAFSHWPTIELHGRLKDMMRSKNRWVSTLDIDSAIGSPSWLDFYRIIEKEENKYEVHVIPGLGFNVDFKDMGERLSKYINPQNIVFKEATRFSPLRSMKIGLTQTNLNGAPEFP